MPKERKRRRREDASTVLRDWHDSYLLSKGVPSSSLTKSKTQNFSPPERGVIRIMQWNLLASSLADDGFFVQDIFSDDPEKAQRDAATCASKVKYARKTGANALEIAEENASLAQTSESHKLLIDWTRRWAKMREMISSLNPDIVCMQEVDRMKQAVPDLRRLGYSCSSSESNASYTPPRVALGDGEPTRDAFCQYLASSSLAYIPSVPSTARKKGAQNGDNEADDDGCVIFWRSDSWMMKHIDYLVSKKSEISYSGFVCAHLKNRLDGSYLSVMSGHLSSGQKSKDEAKRVHELESEVVVVKDCGDEARSNIRDYIGTTVQESPIIVCLDANSSPGRLEPKTTWKHLRNIAHVCSVWDEWWEPDGSLKKSGNYPVTTNKMRGPLSGQKQKVGEHACETIDHIFYSSGFVAPKHVFGPIIFTDEVQALHELLPSIPLPSDHYPVVVDLTSVSIQSENGHGSST